MNSILISIKKLLGIEEAYTHFDTDIIMHINSVLVILNQLGVGPSEGFSISSSETTWIDFMPTLSNSEIVKTYVYFKVKLLFDPPTSSAVAEAMNRMISELEWRIRLFAESTEPAT